MTKRNFLKLIFLGILGYISKLLGMNEESFYIGKVKPVLMNNNKKETPLVNRGVDRDGYSRVYMVKGNTPEENMDRLLEKLGGIRKYIDKDDIVILKPNSQWWNQGMTNTNAMKRFIEQIFNIPSFKGEIIIADNHQFKNPDSRAWTTAYRNGDFNYNELIEFFKNKGFENISKYHWRGAGPNPKPLQGDDSLGSKRVNGPGEGDGYVWRDDLVYESSLGRKCMMTYPVFTSAYSGITIDFKNGAWKDGKYLDQAVKFINFSVINHHGPYVGVTASIKNYMGIVDMTCGFQGTTPENYWNTHYIGLRVISLPFQDKMHWRIRDYVNQYNWKYFHHTAGVLGMFMREIRMADLNFITAHWVGYGSRTNTALSGYPRALLASTDPVALDYIACRDVLMPLTSAETSDLHFLKLNDVTNEQGAFYQFLSSCNLEGIGTLNPNFIKII